MTYEQFIRTAQRSQRAYIRFERRRMAKALALLHRYNRAMYALKLHPLNSFEIADRLRELEAMERNIHETPGDTPMMRWAFEDRQREIA